MRRITVLISRKQWEGCVTSLFINFYNILSVSVTLLLPRTMHSKGIEYL